MPEITMSLSERAYQGLLKRAKREGKTPQEALAEYVDEQLARKTKPGGKGKVRAFHK